MNSRPGLEEVVDDFDQRKKSSYNLNRFCKNQDSCIAQLLRMQQEDGLEDLASYFVTKRKQNSDKANQNGILI